MIFLTEANCFAFLLARAIVANYARHQNELSHHWTSLIVN